MGKAYRFVDFPQNRPIGIDVQPRLHELEDLEGTSKSGQSVQAGVTLASIRHVSLPSCGRTPDYPPRGQIRHPDKI